MERQVSYKRNPRRNSEQLHMQCMKRGSHQYLVLGNTKKGRGPGVQSPGPNAVSELHKLSVIQHKPSKQKSRGPGAQPPVETVKLNCSLYASEPVKGLGFSIPQHIKRQGSRGAAPGRNGEL